MELFFREYAARCGENKAKEDLIILHGLFGISDNWVGYARKLSTNRKIIIPDLRNHGQSPHDDSFELDDLVNDLHTIIKNNNIAKPVIMGHSLGGRIAMRYAILYGESISSIIVIDMSMRSVRKKPEHLALISLMTQFPINEMESLKQINEYLEKKDIKARLSKIIIKNIRKNDNGFEWKVYFKPLIELFDKESEPLVNNTETFNKECLFIRGGNSDYVLDSDIPNIIKHFPKAKINTIKDASHWVHADQPVSFMKSLEEFL